MDIFNASKMNDVGLATEKKAQKDDEKLKELNSTFNDLLQLQIKGMSSANPMQQQDPGAMMQMTSGFISIITGQKVLTALDSIEEKLAGIENSIISNKSTGFVNNDFMKFLGDDAAYEFYIDEDAKVESAKFRILDNDNNVLYEEDIKNPKPGHNSFTWNGKTLDGKTLNSGAYRFNILAIDSEGKAIKVEYNKKTGEQTFSKV